MKTRSLKIGLLAALLVASPLSVSDAQRGDRLGGNRQGGGGRQNRAQLEQNVRQRLARLLQTQLGLTDDVMRQLSDVNQRFDLQRRDVNRREMMTRRSMRDEVQKIDSADNGKIDQLMKEQFKLERERIDLTESEQLELSKFLTPVQRARYLGVQEQVRREMEQLRGRMGDQPLNPNQRRRPPPG